MMLSRDTVIFQLNAIATLMRRKIDAKTFDAYHRVLSTKLDEEQFVTACMTVVEEDDKFPSMARILAAGRAHRKRERGVPHVFGMPLSELFSDIDAGRTVSGDESWKGREGVKPVIERLIYEDAVATTPLVSGEPTLDRLNRIVAKSEAEIVRIQAQAQPPSPPATT